MIIPAQIKAWLDGLISEKEAQKRTGGTRQNWQYRKPKIRANAGVQIKAGVWLYDPIALDGYLQQTAKYRP